MPKNVRQDTSFRRRFAYFLASISLVPLAAWAYSFLGTAFYFFPSQYQWVLALFSPLVRELFLWLVNVLAYRAAGKCALQEGKLSCLHWIGSRHALFLAITLGSVATSETTYIVLGLDFFINIYSALRIIFLIKFSQTENSRIEGKIVIVLIISRCRK